MAFVLIADCPPQIDEGSGGAFKEQDSARGNVVKEKSFQVGHCFVVCLTNQFSSNARQPIMGEIIFQSNNLYLA